MSMFPQNNEDAYAGQETADSAAAKQLLVKDSFDAIFQRCKIQCMLACTGVAGYVSNNSPYEFNDIARLAGQGNP